MSHEWMSLVTVVNESRLTCAWVMSRLWISHVTVVNGLCHACGWDIVTSANESCHSYEWVTSRGTWVCVYVCIKRRGLRGGGGWGGEGQKVAPWHTDTTHSTCTCTFAHTHVHRHAQPHTHAETHAQALTHIHRHTHVHTCTTCTRVRTHSYTNLRSWSLRR